MITTHKITYLRFAKSTNLQPLWAEFRRRLYQKVRNLREMGHSAEDFVLVTQLEYYLR